MEENKKSKLQEALKNKLNKKNKSNKNITNQNNTNKLKESFTKRNKIHLDNLGKRPQNRGD